MHYTQNEPTSGTVPQFYLLFEGFERKGFWIVDNLEKKKFDLPFKNKAVRFAKASALVSWVHMHTTFKRIETKSPYQDKKPFKFS